jgi:hypothetical protein
VRTSYPVVDTERVAMLVSVPEGSRCGTKNLLSEKFAEDLSMLGRCEIITARGVTIIAWQPRCEAYGSV